MTALTSSDSEAVTSADWGLEMIGDANERMILATLVSIIILAFVFVSVAWTCPECMPWHRPDARQIRW
jgi:hypothetical protein